MLKLITKKNENILLKAAFSDDKLPSQTIKEANKITEFLSEEYAVAYLGSKEDYTVEKLRKFAKSFTCCLKRVYTIDVESFATKKVSAKEVVRAFYWAYDFNNSEIFSLKTSEKSQPKDLYLFSKKDLQDVFETEKVFSESITFSRNLQRMVPNICNSEYLADAYKKELSKFKNLKVTVLNKKQIEENNMGLLLSVNRGSVYEPRLVVVEYNGNPDSDEKLALVGKGITFDSGGYSLKTPRIMIGMKYDMSGSSVCAGAIRTIAALKPKANVVAVLPLTDNRINGDASLPDSVWTSMNGKTVEINNTDAEGRLVLADGITYAIRKLHATKVLTVATLTGAILVGLGQTYTGVWASCSKDWQNIEKSAEAQHELVWRMPLHEDYAKNIRDSKVADLKNTDLSGNAGSCSAAMFLKEFAEKADFMHFDIAGTNDINDVPQGVIVKTLYELSKNIK